MRKIYLAVTIVFLAFVGLAWGLTPPPPPPPPVPQNLGIYDTSINHLVTNATDQSACRSCHLTSGTSISGGYNNTVGGVPTRHHSLLPRSVINPLTNATFGCNDCHPSTPGVGNGILLDRSCLDCHNGTSFYGNNIGGHVGNITIPHHVNTSYASSNIGNPAANRTCNFCHGSFVDNYNDGHYKPSYATDFMITPYATFKSTNFSQPDGLGGNKVWGGCNSCHVDNNDTHHSTFINLSTPDCVILCGNDSTPFHDECLFSCRRYGKPTNCYGCHGLGPGTASPLRLNITNPFTGEFLIGAMELRNSTIEATDVCELGTTNISINGTGCEKCHSVKTLHNIQYNYSQNGPQGFGHINNNTDCNGCHSSWLPATDFVPDAIVPSLDAVSPLVIAVNTAATLNITGSNFVNDIYTSVVNVDGVTYTPASITDTQIVVDIPALSAGTHQLQLVKGGDTLSKLYALTVAPNPKITTARLGNGVITITGLNFGSKPITNAQYYVSVNHAGNQTISTQINSWSSTQIKAKNSAAALGDWVTVMTQDAGEVKAQITR